ncbi:MAG: DNA polymerase IV [Methyloceanibacter sp.]
MIRSEKVWPRIVAHADMDAFYAAIEQLDDASLRGRPLLVGPPSARGVVLTASYEARPYGVGSAMPMAKARRMCPNAVIIPPRFDRYQEVSATIMRVFSDFSPGVETLSLDEAFLDMTGSEQLFGDPESIGRRLKAAIRDATGGLTASLGLSVTKYVAKVASAFQKPDGLTVVPPEEAKAWLAPLPVSWLWGAGPKTQARLHQLGLHTIGDVAHADPRFLSTKLGSAGVHFHTLAQAEDPRAVIGRRASKSIGSEHTLDVDVLDKADIKFHLRRSADTIGRRLRKKNSAAFGVGIKLKTSEFQILIRQHRLNEPTDIAERLYSAGVDLLSHIDHPGPFRLIGLVAYDLVDIDDVVQLDLFSTLARQRKLEVAIDGLADRFGTNVVYRADDLKKPPRTHFAPTLDVVDDRALD